MRSLPRLLLLCLAAALAALGPVTANSAGDDHRSLSFLDGLSLIVLDSDDIASMHRVRRDIVDAGGRVAIMSPPSLMLAWVPDDERAALAARPDVRGVFDDDVAMQSLDMDAQSRAAVTYFSRVKSGKIELDHESQVEAAVANGVEPLVGDGLNAPPLEIDAYIENLRRAGIDVEQMERDGLALSSPSMGNSDDMTGTVTLTLFFVESDGTGTDPNTYDWTSEDTQKYLDGVLTGLTWWASKAPMGNSCSVTWLIRWYSGADPRCQQWVEPVIHGSSFESTWIGNVMTNFGYTSGSYFTRVTSFNSAQRILFGTDRAYSAFIPNNVGGSPSFLDGRTAYAYLGGPFTVLLFNVLTPTQNVFAHESGHIFGACDEYAGGCSVCTASCGSFPLHVDNGNCETCNGNSRDCIMKFNDFVLCQYTPGQVGWEMMPCTPPPPPALPAPSVVSVSPISGLQGVGLSVEITGANLAAGAFPDLGPGVFVDSWQVVDIGGGQQRLDILATVLNDAALGLQDVVVKNPDGQQATLVQSFEILPTRQHYYSPTGGNIFPYITPADAATDLVAVIAATFDGDTCFVETTTFNNINLSIDRGVLLSGGWNSSFTQRDLIAGKTVINLNGDVFIFPGVNGGGLDGFIIRGGSGTPTTDPFPADVGGGIKIFDATVTVANCEILMNSASNGGGYGVGGGIFARNSAVTIRDNILDQNDATQGGAIYLHNCSGSISDNQITGNTVALSSQDPEAAGVALVNCDNVDVANNTFTNNSGAKRGGGLYINNSTSITITGGTMTSNAASAASGDGGGVTIVDSQVLLQGAAFDNNSSALTGGALHIDGATSDVTVFECDFDGNSSLLGGGVYVGAGAANLLHNLFTSNSATVTGGAVFAATATPSMVAGNTLYQNTSPGVGGLSVSGAGVTTLNNIVANSSGHGISCGSGSERYNLVWQSSGNDFDGCPAAPGSSTGDPLFVNAAGSDFHLGQSSPAIDAADPDPAYDDPDGSRGDMGIYGSHVFTMDQPGFAQGLTAEADGVDVKLSWTPNGEGDVAGYAVYCDSTSGFVPSTANFVVFVTAPDSMVTVPTAGDSSFYVVAAVDNDGYAGGYSNEATLTIATAIVSSAPRPFALHQNIPNPFNPVTTIRYDLLERASVELVVYDVNGRQVRALVNSVQGAGAYAIEWDGRDQRGASVASGIYFYRLQSAGDVQTRKMVLLK